jgi:hypothetical protein
MASCLMAGSAISFSTCAAGLAPLPGAEDCTAALAVPSVRGAEDVADSCDGLLATLFAGGKGVSGLPGLFVADSPDTNRGADEGAVSVGAPNLKSAISRRTSTAGLSKSGLCPLV